MADKHLGTKQLLVWLWDIGLTDGQVDQVLKYIDLQDRMILDMAAMLQKLCGFADKVRKQNMTRDQILEGWRNDSEDQGKEGQ